MRILLTGGSSFTGMWFARELTARGHEVTATFRRKPDEYPDALRRRRTEAVEQCCVTRFGVAFGDDQFLDVVREGEWDVLAHHAADVTNYRSPDFDVVAALQNNTRNISAVLRALSERGCRRVVLTGSVFEGGEGAGSEGLPHFSAYGLSKALTAQLVDHHCRRAGLSLGKFVVPNPFGPFEEPRYTAYLVRSWMRGETPACANPLYVRDNVHVSLLAKAYVRFVEAIGSAPGFTKTNPSGYVETQGAFTLRVAAEMRRRLGLPCAVEMNEQIQFSEPRVRINTDPLDARELGWTEAGAWDALAEYYRETATDVP